MGKDESGAPKTQTVVETERIPVVEERLRVGKAIETGRTVRVTTRPVTETTHISEPLMREDVTVERVPVGKVIETMPPIREEGGLTVIPVVEERMTVTVELVLVEEIHLRRSRRTEQVETSVDLRKTEVEISD